MKMVNFYYFHTGLLALAMSLWVSNPLGLKDSMVPFLVVEDPFFLPVEIPLLLVGRVDLLVLSLPDNVWTQAMEKLGKWRGNVPAQGIFLISLQMHCRLNILTIANISDRVNIAFVWETGSPCLRFTQR